VAEATETRGPQGLGVLVASVREDQCAPPLIVLRILGRLAILIRVQGFICGQNILPGTLVPSYFPHETYQAFFRYVRVFGGGGRDRKFGS